MTRKFMTAILTAGFAFAVTFFAAGETGGAQDVVILSGNIKSAKLKAKKVYLLQGGVFITKKIKVQAGTQVLGSRGSFLVINQDADLKFDGTATEPIVLTSDQPAGQRRPGDWGGLIINGRGPINVPGGTAQGEGNTGAYGGGASPNPADGEGSRINYTRVEYGGFAISPENELNGIAFQGTGSGLQVDFIQSAWGADDGIEFFGGTTNMKHAVIVGALDDMLDWTFGWTGKAQFVVIQQRQGEADNGIEADNNENDFNFAPRSNPRIINVTMVGPNGGPAGPGAKRGMLLRRGTAGDLRNFIVTGFNSVALTIDGAATFDQVNNNALTLRGFIFFNNGVTTNPAGANYTGATATAVQDKGVKIMTGTDPQLRAPFSTTAPDFRPQAGSPALAVANVESLPANDTFFTTANYVGAFDANTDWTLGWTQWVFGN